MATEAHFINVGQGNMTLLLLADGQVVLYDCNVTNDNADDVLKYLRRVMPKNKIDIFINSHRDADHMRGVKRIDALYPIQKVWDSGVTGGTPNSTEYREYMELRRRGFLEVEARHRWDFGLTRLRVMNAKNDDLPDDPNAQSIVMKVEHRSSSGSVLDSVMLTGDSDAIAWRRAIVPAYSKEDLKSSLLVASHHGAISFFDDPGDEKHYYTTHAGHIDPAMVIVSVGDNPHGHPEDKALELYEKYARGSDKGNKIVRTDEHGHIKVILKDGGGWSLLKNQ